MDFTFNDEQLMFRKSIADMLKNEVTPESIRERWTSDTGYDRRILQRFVELGVTSILVPEQFGGLGLSEVDMVLLAEECGRYALPEPIVENTMVSTRLLADLTNTLDNFQDRGNQLLADIMSGSTIVTAGHWINPYMNFASESDWFLLPHGDEIHLVGRDQVSLMPQKSVDPSRRLYRVEWQPIRKTLLTDGNQGAMMWRSTLNRGALGAAAKMLGVAQAIVEQSVTYCTDREQFGRPIGTNQAVKHLLADCAVAIEFAKPVVYRAAYTVSIDARRANCAVSHAKTVAGEASMLAARNGIQVHGAMGYTWECNLQIFAKRAWAMDKVWGDTGFHKNRIHEWLLNPKALIGAEFTFGDRQRIDGKTQTTADFFGISS